MQFCSRGKENDAPVTVTGAPNGPVFSRLACGLCRQGDIDLLGLWGQGLILDAGLAEDEQLVGAVLDDGVQTLAVGTIGQRELLPVGRVENLTAKTDKDEGAVGQLKTCGDRLIGPGG